MKIQDIRKSRFIFLYRAFAKCCFRLCHDFLDDFVLITLIFYQYYKVQLIAYCDFNVINSL